MNRHLPPRDFRAMDRRPEHTRSVNIGSIVNRVYESSGPAGKFRGTAQQLVAIWQHHAREAELRNDPVGMQACLQYAEHYRRIMNRIEDGLWGALDGT